MIQITISLPQNNHTFLYVITENADTLSHPRHHLNGKGDP